MGQFSYKTARPFARLAILAGLALVFAGATTSHATGDSDDDSDAGLEIQAVFVDDAAHQVTIVGSGMDTGRGPLHVSLGGTELLVISADASTIVVALPEGPVVGDFRLEVSNGRKKRDSDQYDLTVNSVPLPPCPCMADAAFAEVYEAMTAGAPINFCSISIRQVVFSFAGSEVAGGVLVSDLSNDLGSGQTCWLGSIEAPVPLTAPRAITDADHEACTALILDAAAAQGFECEFPDPCADGACGG